MLIESHSLENAITGTRGSIYSIRFRIARVAMAEESLPCWEQAANCSVPARTATLESAAPSRLGTVPPDPVQNQRCLTFCFMQLHCLVS